MCLHLLPLHAIPIALHGVHAVLRLFVVLTPTTTTTPATAALRVGLVGALK